MTGVSSNNQWYVPQFTIQKDNSISSHYGLAGEDNRRKLAQTFKRPTTWKDYCQQISSNNCAEDDGVAKRPPAEDGSEDNKFFSSGVYTGYFRFTEKNDCNTYPDTCTGHFLDYPCGWTTFFTQQSHHLGIALESDGPEHSGGFYTYGDLVDIWFAANATKSDVIGMWWEPDATVSVFEGSGSDMVPVSEVSIIIRTLIESYQHITLNTSLAK